MGVGCRAPSGWRSGELSSEPSPSRHSCFLQPESGAGEEIRGGQGLKNLSWGEAAGWDDGCYPGAQGQLFTNPRPSSLGLLPGFFLLILVLLYLVLTLSPAGAIG